MDMVNQHGVWPWYLVADTLNKPEQPAPTYLSNKKHHVSLRQKTLWHPLALCLICWSSSIPSGELVHPYVFPLAHCEPLKAFKISDMKTRSLTSGTANPKSAERLASFTPLIQQLHCRARFPCCNLFSEIWWGGVSWNADSRCLFQNVLTVTGTSSDGEVVKGPSSSKSTKLLQSR